MIFRLVAALTAIGIALFSGCASATRSPQAAPSAGETTGSGEATAGIEHPASAGMDGASRSTTHKKTAPAGAKPVGLALQPGEYAVLVTSDQPGATVVVNGKPSGKTPCSVVVQANGRGFLRERVSIKVRFIAADERGMSQTVEDELTTLDRVPTEIRFTASGTTRVVR